jgi:exosortase
MTRMVSPSALLGLYTVLLLGANAAVLSELVAFAKANSTASHIVLVPFVTLVLLYQARARVSAVSRPAWSGFGIIAAALTLLLVQRALPASVGSENRLSLEVAGLVLSWVGGFVSAYGWRATRVALFPLLFLVFTVPPPTAIVDFVTEVLRRGSTEVVASLFKVTGTPHFRDGFVFALPAVTIEIADECSGIRSSIALFLTALLAGHTFLGRPVSRVLLLVAVLPVAIIKNGVRIVTLSLLATNVDPAFLTGQLHQDGGVLFFLLSLAILAPVLFQLKRAEGREDATA